MLHVEVENIDEKICKELARNQSEAREKEFKELFDLKSKKGQSAVVFKIKEKLSGKRKNSIEPSVILHPEKKTPVTNPKEITKISADYVVNLLKNREPKHEYKLDIALKREVHSVRMLECEESELVLTRKMFFDALEIVKRKGGSKYEFVLKAGESLLNAFF